MSTVAFTGRVVTPVEIIDDGAVVVEGRHIAWVGRTRDAVRAGFGSEVGAATPAGQDGYLLPGLVDVHCHGGGGESFPNAETPQQAMVAIEEHRRFKTMGIEPIL